MVEGPAGGNCTFTEASPGCYVDFSVGSVYDHGTACLNQSCEYTGAKIGAPCKLNEQGDNCHFAGLTHDCVYTPEIPKTECTVTIIDVFGTDESHCNPWNESTGNCEFFPQGVFSKGDDAACNAVNDHLYVIGEDNSHLMELLAAQFQTEEQFAIFLEERTEYGLQSYFNTMFCFGVKTDRTDANSPRDQYGAPGNPCAYDDQRPPDSCAAFAARGGCRNEPIIGLDQCCKECYGEWLYFLH
jgi:hypothetical protein